jgi:ADP-ribose pyrophosphatase YjhB (NUDIX family)
LAGRVYAKQPLLGVGAVLKCDDRILLIKRKTEPYKNYWTLPGGLIRLGEPIKEAVKREIYEECNLQINPTRLVDVIDYIERDSAGSVKYHYIIVDYEAEVVQGSLSPSSDVSEARWFTSEEVVSLPLPQITKEFLNKHYHFLF